MKKARTTILLQSQIETAMKMTRSNASAAEYLRVSYNLYKKFAKLYKNENGESLFDAHLNQSGRGVSKTHISKKRIELDEVILGRHSNYPREKLLRRLIISGYIEEKCNHCGYCQKRPSDLKTPLILHTINGNKTDFRLENLEVLCFNCYFVIVGNISRRDIKHNRYDAPEQHNPTKVDLVDDEKSLQALSTMDLLTDEEKMELINKLNDI